MTVRCCKGLQNEPVVMCPKCDHMILGEYAAVIILKTCLGSSGDVNCNLERVLKQTVIKQPVINLGLPKYICNKVHADLQQIQICAVLVK